jgi:hypothetical protein
MDTRRSRGLGRRLAYASGGAVLAALLLALPARDADVPPVRADERPFIWGRDSLWRALEGAFVDGRAAACDDSAATQQALLAFTAEAAALRAPRVAQLDSLTQRFLLLAPRVAPCPSLVARYAVAQSLWRGAAKRATQDWDPNDRARRDALYRALYGSRAAVEEAMLQQPDAAASLVRDTDVPSATPSAVVQGVTLHSGDILVSRGGYPTSALIARGNDYPGNFSHIALVHVDPATQAVSVIEAHIEIGVAVTSAEGYLADKKLRVMVLRPRADLPAIAADPQLPHRAAQAMLDRARREHIPYDFAMDYADPSRLFCSEVASQGYRGEGVTLWMGRSTISRPGLRQWLGSFGVRHFETQEPSDLEYDPQLAVVAEWRDAAALFEDHVDNAVTDAMLEGADGGDRLGYAWYEFPVARVLKGWSWLRERMGGVGPIPEGMAPAAALRNRSYNAEHDRLGADVMRRAEAWRTARGYPPPYWVLVALAREARAAETGARLAN